jgi:hypothetical protein
MGVHPEAVLTDKIYLTRANRRYYKNLEIRISGPKLGRPSKVKCREQKQIEKQGAEERKAIEGKFGE